MRAALLILSLSLLSGVSMAASGWQECRQLANDSQRLACYDEYAAMLERKNRPPGKEEQKAAFGLPKTSPADELEGIQAVIRKIEKSARGQRTLYLDNGQIWRQLGSSSQPRLKSGKQIIIERGALGSYVLKPVNSNRSMRVKRLH